MNRQLQLLSLLMLLVTRIPIASAMAEGEGTASWDRYQVLSERNIFVRNRGQITENKDGSAQTVKAIDDTDQYFVLTGTAQRGQEGIAFVEDIRSGQTVKVRTGDPIGKGKLIRITLDHAEYECEGKTTRIEIGNTFTGITAPQVSTVTAVPPEPGISADPSRSAHETDADKAAVIEQMRKRREQQMGR